MPTPPSVSAMGAPNQHRVEGAFFSDPAVDGAAQRLPLGREQVVHLPGQDEPRVYLYALLVQRVRDGAGGGGVLVHGNKLLLRRAAGAGVPQIVGAESEHRVGEALDGKQVVAVALDARVAVHAPGGGGCAVEQAVAADAEVAHAHLAAEMLVQARREGRYPRALLHDGIPEHGHDAGGGQGVVLLHDHLGERGGGAGDVPGQHAFGKVCPEAGLGQRGSVAVVALDGAVGKDAHKIAGGDLFAAGIIKADGDGAARLHGQRDPVGKNVPLGHQRKAGVAVHGERAHGIGHKAALCVRQADGGVAHPHGSVGIIIAEFYIDGAAGKIVGGEDAHGARGVVKGLRGNIGVRDGKGAYTARHRRPPCYCIKCPGRCCAGLVSSIPWRREAVRTNRIHCGFAWFNVLKPCARKRISARRARGRASGGLEVIIHGAAKRFDKTAFTAVLHGSMFSSPCAKAHQRTKSARPRKRRA